MKSLKALSALVPTKVKGTLMIRGLGFLKIPMLFFLSPSVVELDDYRCVVKIPLTRRSKNHLNSMYFGALAVGADCAGGLFAWKLADDLHKRHGGKRINLVFKDFKAEFHKRAEGDVYFSCEEGQAVRELVEKVAATGERHQIPVNIKATVPSKSGDEAVASFVLTLSMK